MKKNKTKRNTLAFALLIILSASIVLSTSPQIHAATITGWKQSYVFLGLSRNPVGVGQAEILNVGISDPIMTGSGWIGLSVTVTKPDGTNTTISDIRTDPAGSSGVLFVPDQVGNYTLQSHFPEQWYNYTGTSIFGQPEASNILYKASDSPIVSLTVQAEPVPDYPIPGLPTEYWSRPINSQLSAWYTIGGNWLVSWDADPSQNFIASGNDQAPKSAHILWTKPLSAGGLVGVPLNSSGYDVGEAYEYQFAGSLVINGVLYYNRYPSTYASAAKTLVAVDIRTGEELWTKPGLSVNRGQLLEFSTEDQHGTFAYLWARSGTTWSAYNAMTGDWMYNMTNVPSGTIMNGPRGEILILVVNQANGWMALWNSSAIPALRGGAYSATTWQWNQWRPWGKTIDAQAPCPEAPETPTGKSGYSWNVTIPTGLPGSVVRAFPDDIVYGYSRGATVTNQVTLQTTPTDQFYAWAVSLKPQTRGQLLWNKTQPLPSGNITITHARGPSDAQSRTFVIFLKETKQWTGYNLDTGNYLWTTDSQHYMDQYSTIGATWGVNGAFAYGRLYAIHYGGILYAYDATTGKTLWTYTNADPYGTELRNTNFPSDIVIITNGMVIITPSEFNPLIPRPAGAYTVALNATTGEVIWKLNLAAPGGTSKPVIGDNIIAAFNEYDNQIYSIGKGPTAVSVTAPTAGVTLGNSVIIRGTVTDISAGTTQSNIAPRFPNGVPAVSDDSMTEWMQYVYMQLPRPTNTTGVQVTLSVVDANGNYRQIGSVTTDVNGFFSLNWKPDIEGQYTVYASFAGSESYWSSNAVTAFVVDPAAPTPAPTQSSITSSAAETYLLPGIVAIIIAIAVVGAVLALLVTRKRP